MEVLMEGDSYYTKDYVQEIYFLIGKKEDKLPLEFYDFICSKKDEIMNSTEYQQFLKGK